MTQAVNNSELNVLEEIFLAYDIRGPYPTLLDEKVVLNIGEILAEMVSTTAILVGHDNRSSSTPLARSLIRGIQKGGIDIKMVGFIANGAMYHAAWRMGLPAAYITASHVPPPVNGIKFIKEDGTSFLDELKLIKKMYVERMKRDAIPSLESIVQGRKEFQEYQKTSNDSMLSLNDEKMEDVSESVVSDYISFLRSALKEQEATRKLKIVVDAMYGATTSVLSRLFKNIEMIEPILLRCPPPEKVPLDYGGIIPEPSKDQAKTIISTIREHSADFGVMFDGDGDRALFIDDQGRPLEGTLFTAVLAKFLLEEHQGGTVVVPVDATLALTDVIMNHGGTIEYVRIGHSFIEQAIKKENVILCGESSHHYYFPKLCPFSDGILSMMVLSHYLAKNESARLSQLIDALPKYVLLRRNVHFSSHAHKKEQFDRFKKEALREFDPNQVLTLDGVKVKVDESSWFLVRPSNTEPKIRLIVESSSEKRTNALMKQIVQWLKDGKISNGP